VRLLRGVVVLSTLLTVTGFAQAPAAPSGSASISGRILTSSSQPIAGATVVLGLFADDPLNPKAGGRRPLTRTGHISSSIFRQAGSR
jgi:hypothetical protein